MKVEDHKRWLERVARFTTPDPLMRDLAVSLVLCEIDLAEHHGRAQTAGIFRQMIKKHGVVGAIERWMRTREHGAFDWTVKRGMAEHTFEAVVSRHPHLFTDEAVTAARSRLNGTETP